MAEECHSRDSCKETAVIEQDLQRYWEDHDWTLVYEAKRNERAKKLFSFDGLGLSVPSLRYLQADFPAGLYRHQMLGLERYLAGEDFVLATGTASGKSCVFYAAAIDLLSKKPDAKILAVYPLKALGREQESRWRQALTDAGWSGDVVARIDGDLPISMRSSILRKASVIIVTPDILHAWMVANVDQKAIRKFIASIGIVIVDEVHVYTGVFGSNAAFLFRRLEFLNCSLGGHYRYIVASATVKDPLTHMGSLFGRPFAMIGEEEDTSEQQPLKFFLVEAPPGRDLLSATSDFLQKIAGRGQSRFITFVDSRKQTEHMAAIISRNREKEPVEEEQLVDHLLELNVLPYRAGFEESDRELIQARLSSGDLRGIISTSALELGINIPYLDLAVLVGVPRSGTSFQQRIGRVGRKNPGVVVIINGRDFYSEAVFRNPADALNRPLAESALYLENPRVQYIHAMCLARAGGEYDRLKGQEEQEKDFGESFNWPRGFLDLCRRESAGTIEVEFQNMKVEAGDLPHLTYPLRNIESQFKIEFKRGPDQRSLGSVSYGQMMREAYPGAVYYYTTLPYRVCQVHFGSRLIQVRKERHYTTSPILLPVQVYPNLTKGHVTQVRYHGALTLAETDLQVRESVVGVKERRGPSEISFNYPVYKDGVIFRQPYFTRNYFTTGLVLHHPAFNHPGVQMDLLAQLIYECFLVDIAFDRQDISCATGRLKLAWDRMEKGDRFLTLYDQTYGSLRLTGKLFEEGVLESVLTAAGHLAENSELFDLNQASRSVLLSLQEDMSSKSQVVEGGGMEQEDPAPDQIPIIMPGSVGLLPARFNEEFSVTDVFFSPKDGKVKYRGKRSSLEDSVDCTIPVDALIAVPGLSEVGFYYLETGEIKRGEE